MIEFTLKSDRDAFVEKIKEEGLFSVLAENMDETTKQLFSDVWDKIWYGTSDDDFEQFILDVCDDISYIKEDR